MSVLLCQLLGCTSWTRLAETRPLPTRGTVQVWSQGHPALLRDPRVVRDSLVGRAPLPDTSRSVLPLEQIDSIRVQAADEGKVLIVGTGIAILALLLYAQGLQGMR
jgi:hypothetical protein